MERRSNWRDAKEWRQTGLPFSTTSDEACKLYDAAINQYMGWYSDSTLGGIQGTTEKLLEADPNAVMGHVLALGLELISAGRIPITEPAFKKKMDILLVLANAPTVTDWEKLHVKAIELLAKGHTIAACNAWEGILLEFPLDILAIRFAFDMYVYMGFMPERRDSLAHVMAHWKPSMPMYSYLHGMYSFCLCETNEFDKAEVFGKKALDLNPQDAWATHSLVHVYEMTGRYDDGVQLLGSTVNNWQPQESLACHNYWHWGVFNIEKADYESALNIFDGELCPRASVSRSPFNVSDCSSLLRRLEMEGVPVGERWQDLYETCRDHLDGGNLSPFGDAHNVMCCLGAKHKEEARKVLDNIIQFIREGDSDNHHVKRDVGLALCQSLVAYDGDDYARAVDLLYPIRYSIYRIGGSNAQRDVFHQFLIHAALKSHDAHHHKMARALLAERKAMVEDSTLTDRLMQRTLAIH